MKIKVLESGSEGNGYLLTNANGKTLLVEAGVPAKSVAANADELVGCVFSHAHTDHCGYVSQISRLCPVYETIPNEKISVGDFNIIAFPVLHNVENKGFIIADKVERKVVFFATDLIYNTAVKPYYLPLFEMCKSLRFDLIMLESNYNEYEFKMAVKGGSDVWGVKNHLSNRDCARFLSHICDRESVQRILLLHGSNRIGRGVREKKEPILKLIPKANITVANIGTEIIL